MALYRLLGAMDRREFEPTVVSLIDQGGLRRRIEKLGIEVQTARMKPGRPSLFGLARLISLVNRLQPDLIVGWMHHSCLAAEVATYFTRRRVPTVWSLHYAITPGSPVKKLTAGVMKSCRHLSGRPSALLFVSQAGRRAHERLGYYTANSSVISNGIDVEIFKPSIQARSTVRKELGLQGDTFLIGLIGRYHPMKDHENFLRAAAVTSHKNRDVHFLMLGRGVDYKNGELQALIGQLDLSGRVHLLGECEDTAKVCAALDILSLSSYDESCPNVIGEAMACGVPCVVTDVGDARQIVGDTGWAVPVRNSEALAAAWTEMLELGSEQRRQLGIAARNRVMEQFTIQQIADQYGRTYRGVIARHQHSQFPVPTGSVITSPTQPLEEQLG
jgi:glycosyltransferase involved in cell wall biosynthesis